MEQPAARQLITKLQAQREHSRAELARKLTQRGTDTALAQQLIDEFAAQNWQSDARFAETFVRTRAARGHGPLKIRAELSQRSVSEEEIQQAFAESGIDWVENARRAFHKRFGDAPEKDAKNRAKQQRFLQQRGFDFTQIRSVLA